MSRRNGLRDRWRPIVLRTDAIHDACRVLLLVLHDRMTPAGYVSVPRPELADILDVHEQRITERVAEAVAAGLLQKVGGGYRGVTAQYVAVIPTRKGNAATDTNEARLVTGERLPSSVTFLPAEMARKVTAEPVPITRARTRVTNPTFKQERSNETRVVRLVDLSPWARLGYAPLLSLSSSTTAVGA